MRASGGAISGSAELRSWRALLGLLGLLMAMIGIAWLLLETFVGHLLLHREVTRIGPVAPFSRDGVQKFEFGDWFTGSSKPFVEHAYSTLTRPLDERSFLGEADRHLAQRGYRPESAWHCEDGDEYSTTVRSCSRSFVGRYDVLVLLNYGDRATGRFSPELGIGVGRR